MRVGYRSSLVCRWSAHARASTLWRRRYGRVGRAVPSMESMDSIDSIDSIRSTVIPGFLAKHRAGARGTGILPVNLPWAGRPCHEGTKSRSNASAKHLKRHAPPAYSIFAPIRPFAAPLSRFSRFSRLKKTPSIRAHSSIRGSPWRPWRLGGAISFEDADNPSAFSPLSIRPSPAKRLLLQLPFDISALII